MSRIIRKSLILAAAILPMSLSLAVSPALAQTPSGQDLAQPAQQDAPPAKQDVPQQAAPQAKQDIPQQPAPQAKPEVVPEGGYTTAQLGEALRNMGYEPKSLQNTDGGTYYTLLFDRGTWTFSMTVVESSDHTFIWVSSPLTQIPDATQASTQGLLKLMEQNYKIGPTFFSFRPSQSNRIYISMPISNRHMTPAALRAQIEEYLTTIQDTYPLWDKKAVIATNNAAPQKQASADAR